MRSRCARGPRCAGGRRLQLVPQRLRDLGLHPPRVLADLLAASRRPPRRCAPPARGAGTAAPPRAASRRAARRPSAMRRARSSTSSGTAPYSYRPPGRGVDSSPELKTAAATIPTPVSRHAATSSSGLLEQRVAAGDHDEVERAGAHGGEQRLGRLRADPDRGDEPLVAERGQRGDAGRQVGGQVVLVGIVQVERRRLASRPSRSSDSSRLARMPPALKSHTRRSDAGTANWFASSSRSAVSGLGRSSRPTLVDTTYSARGLVARKAPSRRSESPSP